MTAAPTDHTRPADGSRWAFDQAVTDVFSDMLRRSIPAYDSMREIVFELGSRLVRRGTFIVSLGCSRGDDLAPFVDRFGVSNRYVGLELSEPMLAAATERFRGMIDAGYLELRRFDLARDYFAPYPASLTLSVLSLQFVPVEHRARLLRDVYRSTEPGGAFVLVEKLLGSDARASELLVDAYHAHKARNGYSADEIESKRRSLEGVLVPLSAAETERMLRSAGFETVEPVWRAYNFGAWIAIRSDR